LEKHYQNNLYIIMCSGMCVSSVIYASPAV